LREVPWFVNLTLTCWTAIW